MSENEPEVKKWKSIDNKLLVVIKGHYIKM